MQPARSVAFRASKVSLREVLIHQVQTFWELFSCFAHFLQGHFDVNVYAGSVALENRGFKDNQSLSFHSLDDCVQFDVTSLLSIVSKVASAAKAQRFTSGHRKIT